MTIARPHYSRCMVGAMLSDECVVVARVGGITFYPHGEFIGAFHTAFAERLEAKMPEGASGRAMLRAVATLRSKAAHAATVQHALELLGEHGTELTAADVAERKLTVVATLPLRS